MANTNTLLDALTLRADLVRALAADTGEHAAEIADEIATLDTQIALCLSAEF